MENLPQLEKGAADGGVRHDARELGRRREHQLVLIREALALVPSPAMVVSGDLVFAQAEGVVQKIIGSNQRLATLCGYGTIRSAGSSIMGASCLRRVPCFPLMFTTRPCALRLLILGMMLRMLRML